MKNSAEHLLFGIKIKCWFGRIFSLLCIILFSTTACKADGIIGLNPIPKNQLFLQKKSFTVKVLSALLLENNKKYEKSGLIWRELTLKSSRVQDHVFYNGLASHLSVQSLDTPKSDQSKLILSRFLSWQKKWQQALAMLDLRSNEVSHSIENSLEAVRLNLVLGQYVEAKKIIDQISAGKHEKQMQLEIYKIWLDILQGEKKDSFSHFKKLEENFLYIPLSTVFPEDYLSKEKNSRAILEESLMRFPSNGELYEQLAKLLTEKGLWNALDQLVLSQRFISNTSLTWNLLAEIYLQTGQYKRLQTLIESRTKKYTGPEYFDVLARFAIARKNWELLLQVSKIYQSRFPKLKDGLLYQAIYYQEIGRLEESKDLIKQAGL